MPETSLGASLKSAYFWPGAAVCAALLAPFAALALRLEGLRLPESVQALYAAGWTCFQAGVSAIAALALGLLGARGMLAFAHKKYYFLIEAAALLPCLAPPLILVISSARIIELAFPFPFGLWTLIGFQAGACAGLCAAALARAIQKEGLALEEWALVHGASPWLCLLAMAQTVLRKDLRTLGVLVFAGAFCSLSLPLLTAGSPVFSLEFFIYEQLKYPSKWPGAAVLILLQAAFVFFVCLKGFSRPAPLAEPRALTARPRLLPSAWLILIPALPFLMSWGGLLLAPGPEAFGKLWELRELLLAAAASSALIGLGTGALTLAMLALMALSFQNVKARRLAVSLSHPGSTLTGFAFLLLPLYGKPAVLMKWIFGLGILLFPLIYRFRGELTLEKLSRQAETARFFGAGWGLIFRKILWPQSRGGFFLCAGMAGFWACGDFAYSLIVSGGHWNLALIAHDFFSSYRLDLAVLAAGALLLLSFAVLCFLDGAGASP